MNGKSGRIFGNNIDFSGGELISVPIVEKAVSDLYFVFFSSYLLRMYPLYASVVIRSSSGASVVVPATPL
jgi:hypothetical protein